MKSHTDSPWMKQGRNQSSYLCRILLERMHTLGYYVTFDLLNNLDMNSLCVSNNYRDGGLQVFDLYS